MRINISRNGFHAKEQRSKDAENNTPLRLCSSAPLREILALRVK
jgi:hypothetical protein